MHDGASLKEMADPVYAAGLQFGYNSKFGPIMANLHWNSSFNKVGFYFGIGYDF
jgi:outer membrane translocation and assembly module TamA